MKHSSVNDPQCLCSKRISDMNSKILILLTILLIPLNSIAETIYVTDVLKLKLRVSPDNAAEVVTNLSSGDKLTVLEKQKRYTRVKTNEGKTGWVQSWFLTDKVPATFLVDNLTAEKENLTSMLAKAETKLKNFDSETAKENEQLKNSVTTLSNKINKLTSTRNKLENKLDAQASELAKYEFAEKYNLNLLILLFFMISFTAGFICSRTWMRIQERKRLWGYHLAH